MDDQADQTSGQPTWRQAYLNLPEREKRRLCHSLVKHEPKLWSAWMRRAGLNHGGHRPQKVAERSTTHLQAALDKHLFDPPAGFSKGVLYFFLTVTKRELLAEFLTTLKGDVSGETAVAALETFLNSDQVSRETAPEVRELFRAMAEDGWLDSLLHHMPLDNDASAEEIEETEGLCIEKTDTMARGEEPSREMNLRRAWKTFRELHEAVSCHIKALAGSGPLSGDAAGDFESLLVAREKLITGMAGAGERVGEVSESAWSTPQEAWEIMERFIAHPDFDPVLVSAAEVFWRQVTELLGQARCRNKLPRRRVQYAQACAALRQNLQDRLRENQIPELPSEGAESVVDWLTSASGLDESALETLDGWLTAQGLSELAELLSDLDPSSMSQPEIGVVLTSTDTDESADSPSVSPESAVEPVESFSGSEVMAQDTLLEAESQPAVLPVPDKPSEVCEETAGGPPDRAPQPPPLAEPGPAPLHASASPLLAAATATLVDEYRPAEPEVLICSTDEVSEPEPAEAYHTSSLQGNAALADRLYSSSSGQDQPTLAAHLGWQLLSSGQPALAWWLCQDLIGSGGPPAPLLEMLVLVHWSPRHSALTAERLTRLSGQIAEERDDLLVLAACLMPALLEPESHASQILGALRLHTSPELSALRDTVVDFSAAHVALTPELLDAGQNHAEMQTRQQQARQALQQWWQQAQTVNIISLPAKDVWWHWLSAGGWLHELVKPVLDGAAETSRLQSLISRYSDRDFLASEAERTYDRVLNHRGNLIVRARDQIVRNALEAVNAVAEWLRLENATVRRNDFRELRTRELRQKLETQVPSCQRHIFAVRAEIVGGSEVVREAGLMALDRTLGMLRRLLLNAGGLPMPRDPEELLGRPLLRCPETELDAMWQPQGPPLSVKQAVCRSLAVAPADWLQVAETQLNKGDLLAFQRCLQAARDEDGESGPLSSLSARLDERRRAECDAVERLIQKVEALLDEALRQGLYTEQDYRDSEAALQGIEKALHEGELRFQILKNRAWRVEQDIEARRLVEQKKAEERLESLVSKNSISSEDAGRVRQVLAADLITAVDYLERAERGDALPPVREPMVDTFTRFFCHAEGTAESVFTRLCRHLLESYEAPGPRQMPDYIRRGQAFAGLSHTTVPKPQREEGARFLETWLEVKDKKRITEAQAELIFRSLGFEEPKVTVQPVGGRIWLQVSTRAETSRLRCPLPAYGSAAQGQYRVLCVWHRPSEEEIVTALDGAAHGARLVFHFGSLAGKPATLEQPRRELARLALERRRRFLLLDDVLTVFLAAEGAPRLRAFITCAAPFSHNDPYSATAGQVPPEMFYGREWEMDQISSTTGSSFLYGGRQLGKTVLLKTAAKTFHHPAEGRVALWLDLKDKGIGSAHSLDKLWEILGAEFKALGVLPGIRPSSRPETLLKELEAWLMEEPARRILVLLDESDDFLNADGKDEAQEFRRCSLLKGLMDRTDRRFKVVFAGLHNVQRNTRTANQPLAHFGEPICIGPMLRGQEARAAAELVEHPLRACGFIFDSAQRSQLVTRILAQTNYYPSLIQLFCQKLVEFCFNAGRTRFDLRHSPPWRLTLQHVKEAEKLETVRQSIRDKFILTLDLDKRFRLVAFLIANWERERETSGEGLGVAEVARKARDYWPAGFASTRSDEVFGHLLEEMVGLGVLRRASEHGTYAMRSPNLISLMGSTREIEEELLGSMNWVVSPEYDPQHFHQSLDDVGQERSPFTAHQESRLFTARANVTAVVTLCQLSGRHFMRRLKLLAEKTPFYLAEVGDEDSFLKNIRSLASRTEERLVIAVAPETGWTTEWLKEARQRLGALKSEGRFVTIILPLNPSARPGMNLEGAEIVSLGPWHDSALRHWFERSGYQGDEAASVDFLTATGSWPGLVEDYLRHRHDGLQPSEACERLLSDQRTVGEANQNILRAFGLKAGAINPAIAMAAEYAGENGGDIHSADLEALSELPIAEIEAVLKPLVDLQAVIRSGQHLRLDPVLARCVRTHSIS